MKQQSLIILLVLSFLATPLAQDRGPTVPLSPEVKALPAPSLTVEQKQQIQLVLKDLEIAQLRQQVAKAEFDVAAHAFEAARMKLTELVTQAQVEGFVFDANTLTYSPVLKDKDGTPITLEPVK